MYDACTEIKSLKWHPMVLSVFDKQRIRNANEDKKKTDNDDEKYTINITNILLYISFLNILIITIHNG